MLLRPRDDCAKHRGMEIDTLILGAGAAGLFCAAHAGGSTLVVDHARAPGEKIRISGGGRCNFTNTGTDPDAFLSANPHFCKSALARYSPWDFVAQVDRHGIAWHEKTLGQLFCDGRSTQIVDMLLAEARGAGAEIRLGTEVGEIGHDGGCFVVGVGADTVRARHLIVATGGKSIPKMGATGLAYRVAAQFGLAVTETRAGLVPYTFPDGRFADLAGVSLPVRATAGAGSFDEAMLFTHRGLSGPAMLQTSSFWDEGDTLCVDLSPALPLFDALCQAKATEGRRTLKSALSRHFPARLAAYLAADDAAPLAEYPDARLREIADGLHRWTLTPGGTEGYRTAEVTLGGVDTGGLSSRTMEAKGVPGLHFIGECVDVTGWLGGYNFQWAWASGFAAGVAVAG